MAPQAARRQAPRRRPVDRRHEILVVGGPASTRTVIKTLGKLHVSVRQLLDTSEVADNLRAEAMAVVLVPPLAQEATTTAVAACRDAGPGVPCFVVVPDGYSDRVARNLYDAGASAVLQWPYEALLLPTMVTRLAGVLPKKGNKRGDAALSRSVLARLRIAQLFEANPKVKVVGGVAAVSGRVSALWKRQRIEDLLAHLPGIVAVFTDDVTVAPTKRPDDKILRSIRAVLRGASASLSKTISVSVDGGRAVLAGAFTSHDELTRIVGMVANVDGVRAIENLATVSAPAAARARDLAKRLERGIATLWPHAHVRVTVFGPVAVLTGDVRPLADQRAITQFAQQAAGVGRVVDKLVVTPRDTGGRRTGRQP